MASVVKPLGDDACLFEVAEDVFQDFGAKRVRAQMLRSLLVAFSNAIHGAQYTPSDREGAAVILNDYPIWLNPKIRSFLLRGRLSKQRGWRERR